MTPPSNDRRRFLIGSTSLALAGLNRVAQGGDEPERVRVAVVGTGGRGCDLIRALSTIDGAEIVAVCDDYAPHLDRGREYAGPGVRGFRDLATMLRDVAPKALIVATPLDRHFAMCREAIAAKCDVFCEKTMCYSIAQARELAEIVGRSGVVFQVGLQRRANAIYSQAEAMVSAGMLGRIAAIECRWHRNNDWRRPLPVPKSDPSWPELDRRLNWRLYRDSSQGLMSELASHQLDVANRLLGVPPRRVIGTGGIDRWADGREVFDNVFCVYEYEVPPSTVRVTYSSIQSNAFEGASETVLGTKGTLVLTQSKGLFYREAGADDVGWDREGRADRQATVITSGRRSSSRTTHGRIAASPSRSTRPATTLGPSSSPSSIPSAAAILPRFAMPAPAW